MSASPTARPRIPSAGFLYAIDCAKALNEALGIVADHPSRQPSPDSLCILHSLLDDFLEMAATEGTGSEDDDDEPRDILRADSAGGTA